MTQQQLSIIEQLKILLSTLTCKSSLLHKREYRILTRYSAIEFDQEHKINEDNDMWYTWKEFQKNYKESLRAHVCRFLLYIFL